MNIEKLIAIGLTENQATIYLHLLERGPLTAGVLARKTTIKRPLVYLVLQELNELELIYKDETKKVTQFMVTSPQKLVTLVEKREMVSRDSRESYESSLHLLQQAYELRTGQPGIRFFPGEEGLLQLYKRLNTDRPKEIFLIKSSEVEEHDTMYDIVKNQIQEQVRLGIKVNLITPTMPHFIHSVPKDKERNTERRIIAREVFDTKAQILIWNDSLAITTYRDPIMTTLIEHADIGDTLKTIFGFIWKKSLVDTQENLKKYEQDKA